MWALTAVVGAVPNALLKRLEELSCPSLPCNTVACAQLLRQSFLTIAVLPSLFWPLNFLIDHYSNYKDCSAQLAP